MEGKSTEAVISSSKAIF